MDFKEFQSRPLEAKEVRDVNVRLRGYGYSKYYMCRVVSMLGILSQQSQEL